MSEAAAQSPSPVSGGAPDGATDGELMAATRDGCRHSFGVVVDRYKDALVGYLARLTGSPDRAEDLAQEAFLRLYQSAARYDERGRLQGLLYAIATNLLRSEERRRRRWRLLMPFLASPTTSNGFDLEEPLGERRVLQRELGAQLQQAIADLPLRYRVPLVLYELDDWSYADIAAHLEVSDGTVKSRIHRARQRLREKLTPYRDEGSDEHGTGHGRPAARREPATPA